jgi:hypothetical protein
MRDDSGIDPTWLSLAVRWHATSTLLKRTRSDIFGELRRTGRWLAELHPHVHAPSDWSRELAAEYVAAVNDWTVGTYAAPNAKVVRSGASLASSTKDGVVVALRRFFKDCRLGMIRATLRSAARLCNPTFCSSPHIRTAL